MKKFTRLLFLLMALATSGFVFGQTVSATYTAGDIPTSYGSYDPTCSGASELTVTLPAGTWEVTSVDVAYSMTSLGGGWMMEQMSRLASVTTGVAEASFTPGAGYTGTMPYLRNGVTIANGIFSGNLVFELQAYRTYGTTPACGTTYNKVDNNTFSVTVHYQTPPPPVGNIEGHVVNGDGLAVSNVDVMVDETITARTDGTGYYLLVGAASGANEVEFSRAGYNTLLAPVTVVSAGIVTLDVTMVKPNIVVSPLIFDENLHPNQYLTKYLSLLNTGDGVWNWGATIVYPPTKEASTVVNFDASKLPSNWDGVMNIGDSPLSSVHSNGGVSPLVGSRDDILMYDDGVNFDAIGLTAGGTWQVSTYWPASVMGAYSGQKVKQVEVYIAALGTTTTIKIYGAGTATAPGALLYSQPFVAPAAGWFTVILASPVAITGSDMWVGYELVQPVGIYAAGCDNGPAIVGYGDMITMDGVVWDPLSSFGLNYNWNIHVLVGPGGAGGGWLSLDSYTGFVQPGGGSVNIGTNFDAAGTTSGEVYHADIVITSNPDVGTITIPVTMTIGGAAFSVITGFTAELTDAVNGEATLNWDAVVDPTFDYYKIYRNGVVRTTTTLTTYVEMLPGFGSYAYEVQPVFTNGAGSKAGPEIVEWFQPVLCFDPAHPANTQWPNVQRDVMLELENCGNGVLEFSFPDYAVTKILSDPTFVPNDVSPIEDFAKMAEPAKGELDARDGQGHPVIRGAGGPDAFGYVWIDSDEAGGPVFNWNSIAATGTAITGLTDDNVVGPFAMGFDFPFYDEAKTQFWVNSNGTVIFKNQYTTLANVNIPTNSTTNNDMICWFWDDLLLTTSNVYYQNVGNTMVIEVVNARNYGQTTTFDVQIIMARSGSVLIQYHNVQAGVDVSGNTIGIQSSTPSLGLPVAYNTAYVHNDLALYLGPPGSHFIVDVIPAYGMITEGGTADITLVYSSVDFEEGVYDEDLLITTNEQPTSEWFIPNTMTVVLPATISGVVTNCATGLPMAGVTVTAFGTDFVAETNTAGMYELLVDDGTYKVVFSKVGFISAEFDGIVAVSGAVTTLDAELCEVPYPVSNVWADPNEADTQCMVTWVIPMGPYEIAYDDGSADEYTIWAVAGGAVAVKFTPEGYPATVVGGRINVGDGSFPAGANFLNSNMSVGVLDDDGANGLPGTMLDSVTIRVDNFGWVEFMGELSATVADGNFYLVMWQLGTSTNSAPIAIDNQFPVVYRSYAKMPNGSAWASSPYQDFMMRAYVSGPSSSVVTMAPEQTVTIAKMSKDVMSLFIASGEPLTNGGIVKSGKITSIADAQFNGSRDMTNYIIARVSDFDPDLGPELGVITPIATPTDNFYNDLAFGGLAPGFYAYAVKSVYDAPSESEWVFSNIVAHKLDNMVTVNLTQCDGLEASGAEVSLLGHDYPYQNLFDVTGPSGTVVFDSVIDGTYLLTVYKNGYNLIEMEVTIIDNVVYDFVLTEVEYVPHDLYVDEATSVFTWKSPYVLYMENQGFDEATAFPPAGWQATSYSTGFFHTVDGSSSYFTIPAGDGWYACANDDAGGSEADGCCDYLIMPSIDLSETDGLLVHFDAFFNGAYSETATVEYSIDNGASWTVAMDIPVLATGWGTYAADLDDIAGNADVLVAFHANDNGAWASGLAIDNVSADWGVPPLGYYVYLDGAFVTRTDADVTTYTFLDLQYGQAYVAGVAALYSCGVSDIVEYAFGSTFLYPPRNLRDEYLYGGNEIPLFWNPPMTVAGPVTAPIFAIGVTAINEDVQPNEHGTNTVAPQGTKPMSNSRNLLFDNGTIINSPGTGAGGADESLLQDASLGMGTYGTGVQLSSNNSLADDFEVTASWTINSFTFYGYQTGSTTTSTFTGGYFQIWDGNPTSGGTVIYGDLTTNVMVETDWTGVYRGLESAPGASNRPVMSIVCAATGLTLAPGIYWVEYSLAGSGTSGPWTPAITINGQTNTGNAQQNQAGAWVAFEDVGPQGMPFLIDGTGGGSTGGSVPDGLLGFNLYQNGEFLAEVAYEGQGTEDWVPYVINLIDPGTYLYDVSALYDLGIFGFPGEIGESNWEGTDTIKVVWGFPIPFFEGWDQGTFGFNSWMTDGDNWKINAVVGSPAPAAEFTWDPLLEDDYSSSLTSTFFTADLMTEGKMFFDFDVKLNDRNSTGDEKLEAQVFNGTSWMTVATFANDGNMDWTENHVDITASTMSKVFRVRFTATGMNSFDIISWFVDNIEIYRECESISDLAAVEANVIDALITWNAPVESVIADWLSYDDGVNVDGIGGPATFSWAIKFDPDQIAPYAGASLTKIRIYNRTAVANELRIYSGTNAATLLHTQTLSGLPLEAWSEVALTSPIVIDVTKQLWITVYTADGVNYPAACGNATGEPNGDLITTDGTTWEHLADLGLMNTWNLGAYVTTVTGVVASLPMETPVDNYSNSSSATLAISGNGTGANNVLDVVADRELTGFNVYRKLEGATYEVIAIVPAEAGVEAYSYLDETTEAYTTYFYQVTCTWESATDFCESAPGYNVPMTQDFVELFITDVNTSDASELNLYPNPAKDRVNVTSTSAMNHITVMNYVGQVVYNANISGETTHELNTASYEAGVYVVQITTENGIVTRRVVISE